jgi:hypothetical protein
MLRVKTGLFCNSFNVRLMPDVNWMGGLCRIKSLGSIWFKLGFELGRHRQEKANSFDWG